MKVSCAACGAAFAVGDHLVRGKVVQFKCRKCRAAIRVDGTALSLSPSPAVPTPVRAPPLPSAVADSLEIPADVAPPASSASLRATPNRMALSAGVHGPSVDIDEDVIPISVDDFPWTDPSSDGEDIPESVPPADVLSEPPPLSSRRSEDPGPLPNLPRERESFRAIMDLDGGLMQAGLGPMLRPPDILGALTSTEDASPSGAVTTSAKPSQASSHRPDAGGMGKKITVIAACAVAGLIFYAARTRAPAVDSLGERTPPATEQEPAGPTAENPPPTPDPTANAPTAATAPEPLPSAEAPADSAAANALVAPQAPGSPSKVENTRANTASPESAPAAKVAAAAPEQPAAPNLRDEPAAARTEQREAPNPPPASAEPPKSAPAAEAPPRPPAFTGPASDPGAEFDRDAAVIALRTAAASALACKTDDTPVGVARLAITFAPSGRVTTANVEGAPFAGTKAGGCLAAKFRSVRVPPFGGGNVTVHKSIPLN